MWRPSGGLGGDLRRDDRRRGLKVALALASAQLRVWDQAAQVAARAYRIGSRRGRR